MYSNKSFFQLTDKRVSVITGMGVFNKMPMNTVCNMTGLKGDIIFMTVYLFVSSITQILLVRPFLKKSDHWSWSIPLNFESDRDHHLDTKKYSSFSHSLIIVPCLSQCSF